MAKPPLWLFIGDMHSDSTDAVTTPERILNRRQQWLLDCWRETEKEVMKRARHYSLTLAVGGDLVDLPGFDARTVAYELLRKYTNRADKIYGVTGTEYHVGRNGDEDRSIYQMIGAETKHYHRLTVGNHILDWAHHGVSIGKTPHTELSGMAKIAETKYRQAIEDKRKPPALIARHHVHVVPRGTPIVWRGITVAIVPCWKLPDSFSAKVAPGTLPTIGAMLWYPREHRIEYGPGLVHLIPDRVAYA